MKKYILGTILGLSLILGTSVLADNFNIHYKVYVYEGWNLLQGFGAYSLVPNFISGGDVANSDVVAIYAYLPNEKKYARIYPNPEIKVDDQELLNSAFWVYLKKAGWIEYSVEAEWASANNKQLYAGWNFVGITNDLTGKSLNQIKGNCSIASYYAWQADSQKWYKDSKGLDAYFGKEWVGQGVLVKSLESCKLSARNSFTTPPQLPN